MNYRNKVKNDFKKRSWPQRTPTMFADGGRRRTMKLLRRLLLSAGVLGLSGLAVWHYQPAELPNLSEWLPSSGKPSKVVRINLRLPQPDLQIAPKTIDDLDVKQVGRALAAGTRPTAMVTAVTKHSTTRPRVQTEPELAPSRSTLVEIVKPRHSERPEIALKLRHRQTTVRKGESLSSIFTRVGLTQGQLMNMLAGLDHNRDLRALRPGHKIDFWTSNDSALHKLVWAKNAENSLEVSRAPNGFESVWKHFDLESASTTAAATIDSSLFLAGKKAGLSDRLIMEMVGIFGWDIDFALDVRKGDRFTVIYEEMYKNDKRVREGSIVAAEFINQDRKVRAVRFVDVDGQGDYFTPDGHSMRKEFLRTPVNFSRISSRFSMRRKHPVLHKIRAHKGVDYAATRGTPVKASGDGKVVSVGRKGGYGKTIVLRHGGRYTTLYAHLDRFARKLKPGQTVRQGQIIGYVGSTGLATGPHLHYEFRVNGAHRNPLTVELPRAAPLAPALREKLTRQTKGLLVQLDQLSDRTVALNSD